MVGRLLDEGYYRAQLRERPVFRGGSQWGRFTDRPVFGGGSLWSKIKSFAKRVFGSKTAQKLINQGADYLEKQAPGWIDKGVNALDSKLTGNAKKIFGAVSEKVTPSIKDLVNMGIQQGVAHLPKEALPAAISAATDTSGIAEGSGAKKRRRTKGGGMQTIALSPSKKVALSGWFNK